MHGFEGLMTNKLVKSEKIFSDRSSIKLTRHLTKFSFYVRL